MLARELAEAIPVRLPASEEVHGAVLPALKHLRSKEEDGELAPAFPGPHVRPPAPHSPFTCLLGDSRGWASISLNSSHRAPEQSRDSGVSWWPEGGRTECPQALKRPLRREPGWTGVQ